MKVFGCFLCLSFKIFRNNQKLKPFFLREGSQISRPANDECALFLLLNFQTWLPKHRQSRTYHECSKDRVITFSFSPSLKDP